MCFLITPKTTFASLSVAFILAVSSIHDVSARLVASSDIREQAMESVLGVGTFAKVKGDECIKLDAADISNEENIKTIDLGILGCGKALTCLEDESSSTGARCVEFEEVDESVSCSGEWSSCKNGEKFCKKYLRSLIGLYEYVVERVLS
eukprot:scaffold103287_cov53-Cyclotella_meneghiniana.AAC.2